MKTELAHLRFIQTVRCLSVELFSHLNTAMFLEPIFPRLGIVVSLTGR